ncbi:hypothetical protein TrVE_jg7830 [Triparma verrucosa]|uniref:Uncharacterized protein n=2 Tax=Triparma TaxID=722752 RepID=A0A9W7AXU4_9STRA|nr:hypothetical protein TrST_g6508 [Triparma strigata]GMH97141.1 hypothetical protein TrVE_jg7830 [Triparma verrucosa]
MDDTDPSFSSSTKRTLITHSLALLAGMYCHHRLVKGDLAELREMRREARIEALKWLVGAGVVVGIGGLAMKMRFR